MCTETIKCSFCHSGLTRVQLTDGSWGHAFENPEKKLAWVEPCTLEAPLGERQRVDVPFGSYDGNTTPATPIPSAAPPAGPPSKEDMYRALHDDTTPQPVKRFIRQQLYGEPRGRRELRQQRSKPLTSSLRCNIKEKRPDGSWQMGYIVNEEKLKKPSGISARKWKKLKREVRQEMAGKKEAKA